MGASYLWEEFYDSLPKEDCQSAVNYMLGALIADRSYGDITLCIKAVKDLLGEKEEKI